MGTKLAKVIDSFGQIQIEGKFVEDTLDKDTINRLTKQQLYDLYETLRSIRASQGRALKDKRNIRTMEVAADIWNQMIAMELACRIVRDFITAGNIEEAMSKYEYHKGDK